MTETKAAKPCPICGKDAQDRFAPFCSARCAQVDLNRWLGEVYVVPGSDKPANSDDPAEDADGG